MKNNNTDENNSVDAYKYFHEGKKHAVKNDNVKAIMLFEKAKDLEPEKGSIREALATAYYNSGLYAAAKTHFLKALQINASNDFAHFGLGLCLAKEGKINTAMGHFKLAYAMKPLNQDYIDALEKYNRIFDILRTKLPWQEGQE
jgi:tetratricopeptide (TPR) repeat protein